MAYLLPNQINGTYDLFNYVNTVVPSGFTYVLFTFWIIIFLALRINNDVSTSAAFTTSSFAIFFFSILLSITGLVATNAILYSLLGIALGVAWIYNETRTK